MEKSKQEYVMIKGPKSIAVRHRQVGLLFLGVVATFIIRADISVAIVAMTSNTTNNSSEVTAFGWDERTKGWVLSSFFWGFAITQFPAGFATQIYGAKYILLISVLLPAIFTLMIPMFCHLGWGYVCAIRTLIGLCQAFSVPSYNNLLVDWIQPSEWGLTSIVLAGNTFGIFVIIVISGLIAEFPLRWRGIFYVSGGIGLIWSVAWIWYASELPSEHRTVTADERLYFEAGYRPKFVRRYMKLPWKDVSEPPSFPFAIIAVCGQCWEFYALLMEVPSYMTKSLKYNIKSSSIMAGFPYLFNGPLSGIFMFFGNFLASFAPILVGSAVSDGTDASEWRIVLFVTAALYFFLSMVFIIFGHSSVKHWNKKNRVDSRYDV